MRYLTICLAVLLLSHPASAQDWPQWRGPNRDNHLVGFTAPNAWPKTLKKLWSVNVGIGESSPALVGKKIFVFGRIDGEEVTLCLDAASGKELWRDHYAAAETFGADRGYPGPRSSSAVGDGKVCTLGVHGVVSCLDAASGKVLWRKKTGGVPRFHTSTSPMIVDGLCVVYVDGLTAYDLAGGKAKWQWSDAGAPYGSPVLMTVDGDKQVVTPTAAGSLVGIGLADGKLRWQVKVGGGGFDYQSNFSTPLVQGTTVIYSAAQKGKGAKGGGNIFAFKIAKNKDGEFAAEEKWKKKGSTHQYHAPVLKDGLVFGVSTGRYFFCLDAETGKQLWVDDTQRGQCGCILNAGSVLLALTSDSQLVAFEPSRTGYKELARYEVSPSQTWSVPIIAGQRVYVKDKKGDLTLWTLAQAP